MCSSDLGCGAIFSLICCCQYHPHFDKLSTPPRASIATNKAESFSSASSLLLLFHAPEKERELSPSSSSRYREGKREGKKRRGETDRGLGGGGGGQEKKSIVRAKSFPCEAIELGYWSRF